ncbi:MAG: hypothetical protein JMDDDDMK_05115 [Acidobacteria bacterium]|nr:hypothetical protein [Acidobacteriota bacterium]
MKTNAPSSALWLISVIIGALGIVSNLVKIGGISPYSFWLLAIGFIILVVATVLKGA